MKKIQLSKKGNLTFFTKLSIFMIMWFCWIPFQNAVQAAEPPYSGTIFNFPNSFTDSDPTALTGLTFKAQESRSVYDRRSGMITINAYVYIASFNDGCPSWEMIVNPEFGQTQAQELAAKYARSIGQMPICVRTGISGAVIHNGTNPWAGGNPLTIHHGQGLSYESMGIVTETMIHEATHAAFDRKYYTSDWAAAASADGNYISTYARDNPNSEDHSETFLCWLAARYKKDRISATDYTKITTTVPNRLKWYDNKNLNLSPMSVTGTTATPQPTRTQTPVSTVRKGDVNRSGTIDVVDALMIAQYTVGLNPANFTIGAADVNCSGDIDIVDALMIAQLYVGLIAQFPC